MSGTDTYLSEPMINVPTVWAYSGSGVETHHNSEDTPDRVDRRWRRDVATVNAAYLYYLANGSESEAMRLAELSQTRGYEQILQSTAPFLERAAATSNAQDLGRLLQDALDHVSYSVGRESQAVLSVLRLVPELDRKSTRLNSSHLVISYAVFCLKKKS